MKKVERILLIDDDAAVIFLIKHMLSGFGLDIGVLTAQDGFEGLAHVKNYTEQGLLPNLILLDINMPLMGGFEFMEQLAKLNLDLTDTKIVLLSSSVSPWDKEKAARSMAVAYLHKPLTKEKLLSLLNQSPVTCC